VSDNDGLLGKYGWGTPGVLVFMFTLRINYDTLGGACWIRMVAFDGILRKRENNSVGSKGVVLHMITLGYKYLLLIINLKSKSGEVFALPVLLDACWGEPVPKQHKITRGGGARLGFYPFLGCPNGRDWAGIEWNSMQLGFTRRDDAAASEHKPAVQGREGRGRTMTGSVGVASE